MNDAVEVIQAEPEAVETPVTGLPRDTTVDDRSLDDLLAEYDAKVGHAEPPASDSPVQQDAPVQDDSSGELDKLLAELTGPSPDQQRADALQGQLSELQIQIHRQQELAAFDGFANDLQQKVIEIAPNVPPDYVRAKLESLAHNPELALAWDTRNIDPKAASLDLAHVQHSLNQLQANPNADPKQVQELNRLAYQLNVAAHSHSILRKAMNGILSDARKLAPPIDVEATLDRDAIVQAIRDGQGPAHIPEQPISWGSISAREGREKIMKQYGFDPGWGW